MKKVVVVLFFASLLSLVLVLFNRPVSSDTSVQEFVVSQGDSLSLIATRLETNRLIRNRYLFTFWAYYHHLQSRLQAGVFKLSPSLSPRQMVFKLSTGGSQDFWLKIVDGSRLEEIAVRLPAQEGYLFPDSYLIPKDYTPSRILALVDQNFQKKFNQAKNNATITLADSDIVILASLLEREARLLETKQMVAGIIYNRLKIGMALQIDATAQYARDSLRRPAKYWLPASRSDLKIASPFNTYLHPGLPPAPICNPGYDSLYAAFHPTPSDYLYYITDDSGQIHYAKTLDQHNANIAKFLR